MCGRLVSCARERACVCVVETHAARVAPKRHYITNRARRSRDARLRVRSPDRMAERASSLTTKRGKTVHRLTGFVFVKFVCVTREKRIGP